MARRIDFGSMPLAGAFITREQAASEKSYPLRIFYCNACSLVQVLDVISPDELFRNYFYLSSVTSTLSQHFVQYAAEMHERFLRQPGALPVEIGCNDGVLLAPLQSLGVSAVGVEPSVNVSKVAISKGLQVVNDFFGKRVASDIRSSHGSASAVFANNVFAHIDDLDDVMEGVTSLLADDGVFVFEVHYLPDLLEGLQYDFFYHEHLCYYSLHSAGNLLSRFGMRIFEA